MRLAFIDTETTGLDARKHEVIEIAMIIVENGRTIHRFESKIKPVRIELADARALEINGYAKNPQAWDLAPTLKELGPDLALMLEGCVLVGHNVSFDEEFLKQNLIREGVKAKIPYHKIDTVTLAFEHLRPLGLKRVALDSVRDFLGWSKVGAHTAMKDVEDTKKLFDLLWGMNPWKNLLLRWKVYRAGTK